jgi:hypothetical protein
MNELHESFDARGLTIVGVTSEDKAPTEHWVRKHKAEYAYAYDGGGKLSRYFGVNGIPHAVLIDPSGTVVWSGHPGGLDDSMIEAALAGAVAKPLWTWPADTAATRLQLQERAYAEALASANQHDGPYAEIVQGLIAARIDEVRTAVAAGDYLRAVAAAERSSRDLEGLPEADEAREGLRKIQGDPQKKRIMDGQRELASVQVKIAEVRLVADAKRLLNELQTLHDAYPGTIVASGAAVEIQDLQKRMP